MQASEGDVSQIDMQAQAQLEDAAQEQVKDVPVSSEAWLAEIAAAQKREKNWRKDAKKALERYRNERGQADASTSQPVNGGYNILYSNTETLRNAVYNQAPRPDVRQRWQSKDPLALACAQVLDRSLEYVLDVGNFHTAATASVLDFLLPGRAVMRVRYEPEFAQQALPDGNFVDVVASENIVFEPVSYKDFVYADAPSWNRVDWCAFRHWMTKADVKKYFPGIDADQLVYVEGGHEGRNEGTDRQEAQRSGDNGQYTDRDARSEVWEVWDRRGGMVLWVSRGLESALKYEEPPLKLENFFPCAAPMFAVPSPYSLLPATLYSQYEEQADELDIITRRIEATAKIIKWRGAYASSMGTEVARVLNDAQDGELVPVENEAQIMERGGLDGAFWLFDVKAAAEVLGKLYEHREALKQAVYEITGISDILRGVTRASETATAQQIKAAWGSSRVDGYKREIQRFLADTLRIAAEIISETYQVTTLAEITGLTYPTAEDKANAQAQLQQVDAQGQQAEQAAQMGDQAAQQAVKQLQAQRDQLQKLLATPSWEDIQGVLQCDLQRSYKVEIETDSTIAPNQQQDLKNLSDTMQAIGGFGQVFLPGVQAGIIPPDLFMEILRAIMQKTPLSNVLTDKFDDFLDQLGCGNPLQKQIDQLKGELEQARDERGLKQEQLRLQGAEIQSRERLEGAKLQLEAQKLQLEGADLAQRPQLEAMKAQNDLQRAGMEAQAKAQAQTQGVL